MHHVHNDEAIYVIDRLRATNQSRFRASVGGDQEDILESVREIAVLFSDLTLALLQLCVARKFMVLSCFY